MWKQRGFSLIELSVVLVIIALVLGYGLRAFESTRIQVGYSDTDARYEVIRQALIAHLNQVGRLPCPDQVPVPAAPPDGLEDTNPPPATCVDYYGVLPFQTLNLEPDLVMDGFQNFISYSVTPAWADPTPGFRVGAPGTLRVNDVLGNPITTTAPVVLISHGDNRTGGFDINGVQQAGLAAPSANETENLEAGPTPNTYVQGPFSQTFDDRVTFFSANQLLMPLIEDGSVQSANAEAAAFVDSVFEQAIGLTRRNCVPPQPGVPAGFPAQGWPQADPWSNNYVYAAAGAPINNPPPPPAVSPPDPTVVAVTVNSNGADGNPGNADDIVRSITYAEIIARMNAGECP